MTVVVVDELEVARAQEYALLALLLARSPDSAMLDRLAALRGDGSALGVAHAALEEAASRTDARRVEREYFTLFVGVGRGELLPYASYYLTGALHGHPLASLRQALLRIGIERADGQSEPEDHIALLLDVMAGLAGGTIPAPAGTDREVFREHIAPWVGRFFADLEHSESADFYRRVAQLGRIFIEIEAQAFVLQEAERPPSQL